MEPNELPNASSPRTDAEMTQLEMTFIEWSPDWISILDPSGQLLVMNSGGIRSLEVSNSAELQYANWTGMWRDHYGELAREAVIAARSGELGHFTGFCPTQSGIPKWWDVIVSPIRDAPGTPGRLLAVARDITEERRAQETLRIVTEATAAVSAAEFFSSLARHLARALMVRYVFIAECTDETRKEVRTMTFWAGEKFAPDVQFSLRGTPCERVVGGEVCCYPERLQALFPEDTGLVTLKAESYLGVPLRGSSGEILGHLV